MDELDSIASATLADYDSNAAGFFAGTRDHDVSQNIDALLRALAVAGPGPGPAPAPFTILDFGCGPGRDLATFTRLGHVAVGLDGAAEFVAMARSFSGCTVWHQSFLHLDLPAAHFDGVFANASLFHVPRAVLPTVLAQLCATLKTGGVLFSSNPRGDNQEGWSGDRYGSYHDYASWKTFVEAAGFVEIEHYYRPPGLPRAQQPWLASVWRKR